MGRREGRAWERKLEKKRQRSEEGGRDKKKHTQGNERKGS